MEMIHKLWQIIPIPHQTNKHMINSLMVVLMANGCKWSLVQAPFCAS